MATITFNSLLEQLHAMGQLSDNALTASHRLQADDAFTLSNYLTDIRVMYAASDGDLGVLQELVNVSVEALRDVLSANH